jgi:hypothetical protein
MATRRLTFVSVVFEAEYSLLRLQARSMAAFLVRDLVAEIVVIDNSARGMPPATAAALLGEYGDLSPRVRVLRPRDICRFPGTTGWRSQQILKICTASHLTTERYVVLDAKNHFVSTVPPEFFEAPDGRPRAQAHSYEQHPHRPALEQALQYLGLDPADHVGRFTATVTPFVLDVGIVTSLIHGIERRSRRDFAREFIANDVTEFLLYGAWIVASGRSLDDVYQLHADSWPVVWPRSAHRAGVEEAIRLAGEAQAPVFTVHRKALGRLDAEACRSLAAYWTSRGLFPSTADAGRFLADVVREIDRARLRKRIRIRELPHRAKDVPRRLRRKLRIWAPRRFRDSSRRYPA